MNDLTVDVGRCNGCGVCAAVCVSRVLARTNGHVEVVAAERCFDCGHCVAACPVDAIDLGGYFLDDFPPIDPADLPPADALVATLRARRSCHVYRDRPVDRGLVAQLIDAARWAPSSHNVQAVDWIAFDDPTAISALRAGVVAAFQDAIGPLRTPVGRAIGTVVAGPAKVRAGLRFVPALDFMAGLQRAGLDPIFHYAPVLLIAHGPAGHEFGRDDAVYQAYNIMLAADRLGLGSCQSGYLIWAHTISRPVRELLALPAGRVAQVALMLGYPRYRMRRLVPRRKPVLAWNPGSR
jgi:nitroreductase/NAD-dependent dihydropyrimidine dehydrogenase PreA subunit